MRFERRDHDPVRRRTGPRRRLAFDGSTDRTLGDSIIGSETSLPSGCCTPKSSRRSKPPGKSSADAIEPVSRTRREPDDRRCRSPDQSQYASMPDKPTTQADTFGALGLDEPLLATLAALATRSRPRSSGRPSRSCSRVATCSPRRRPGRARRPPSPFRCWPAGSGGRRPRARRCSCSCPPASSRCRSPRRFNLRQGDRHPGRAVYGGQPIDQQLRGLARGVDVVVATPGRAVDHLTRKSLDLGACARSSSMRPTRCSTWASRTTST